MEGVYSIWLGNHVAILAISRLPVAYTDINIFMQLINANAFVAHLLS